MAKYKKIEEPVFITNVTERKSKHGGRHHCIQHHILKSF